jgi:hypothetical protein
MGRTWIMWRDGKLTISRLDLWLRSRIAPLTGRRLALVMREPGTLPDFSDVSLALVR